MTFIIFCTGMLIGSLLTDILVKRFVFKRVGRLDIDKVYDPENPAFKIVLQCNPLDLVNEGSVLLKINPKADLRDMYVGSQE